MITPPPPSAPPPPGSTGTGGASRSHMVMILVSSVTAPVLAQAAPQVMRELVFSVMLACASVLWLRHPRLRWLYLLAIVLTAIGQLGANYHWLSDVIAGAFLGAATGCFTVWLARRQARA